MKELYLIVFNKVIGKKEQSILDHISSRAWYAGGNLAFFYCKYSYTHAIKHLNSFCSEQESFLVINLRSFDSKPIIFDCEIRNIFPKHKKRSGQGKLKNHHLIVFYKELDKDKLCNSLIDGVQTVGISFILKNTVIIDTDWEIKRVREMLKQNYPEQNSCSVIDLSRIEPDDIFFKNPPFEFEEIAQKLYDFGDLNEENLNVILDFLNNNNNNMKLLGEQENRFLKQYSEKLS